MIGSLSLILIFGHGLIPAAFNGSQNFAVRGLADHLPITAEASLCFILGSVRLECQNKHGGRPSPTGARG